MKSLIRTTIIACLIAVPPVAQAQSSWSTHTRAAEYAFARGDLERAEKEFQAALESFTSENGARMVAMENATSAAGEMIDNLTLEYNKAPSTGTWFQSCCWRLRKHGSV